MVSLDSSLSLFLSEILSSLKWFFLDGNLGGNVRYTYYF